VLKWQREDDQRQKILSNICEYPLIAKDALLAHPDFIIKKRNKST